MWQVLGEAQSQPQAYYIVRVGVCFVIILYFYRFYLWKVIIPYLGRSAAGKNAGLPGSYFLTIYCHQLNNTNNKNKHKHIESSMCNDCAPSKQWRLTWSYVNFQYDVTLNKAAGFTTIWVGRRFEDSYDALAMAAVFPTIWVDRRFGDPCNALAMASGFTTIWRDRRFEDSCNALAGSQLSEGAEGLRTPAMLWQWPQGSQLSEGADGLRTPVMLWQWPQGSQLSEGTEGLRTLAFLWQWPQSLQLSEWTEGLRTHVILGNGCFKLQGESVSFRMT